MEGRSPWFGIIFFCGLLPFSSAWLAASQCVQVGTASSNNCALKTYNDSRRTGMWTIGTRKFNSKYTFLDFGGNGYIVPHDKSKDLLCDPHNDGYPVKVPANTFIHHCVGDDLVEMKVYAVKQDEDVMTGWLHFSIKLVDPKDEILAIYVQVRDEYHNAIGEFITQSNEQCEADDPELAQPSEYQVLPCGAVGSREAEVSTALYMVQPDVLQNRAAGERYLSKKNIKRGVHFTWRMSEYWCNRKLRIRADAFIFPKILLRKPGLKKEGLPHHYRKIGEYWLHHNFFGAADIKLPNTKLHCNEEVIDFSTGEMKMDKKNSSQLVAPWLFNKTTRSSLFNDYLNPNTFNETTLTGGVYPADDNIPTKPKIPTLLGCMTNVRLVLNCNSNPNKILDPMVTFGGRCKEHYKKIASHDQPQSCNLDLQSEEFKPILDKYGQNMTTYSGFVNVLTVNRTRLCQIACKVPTAANLSDIQKFKDNSGETKYVVITRANNGSRLESKVEKFILGRKYHGIMCVYYAILLLPVSLFCARYMKETCMRVDCMGAHFWFWVHISLSLLSVAFFVSSLSSLWLNISIWGRSLHPAGSAHRLLGYSSTTLFWLLVLMGSNRAIRIKFRLITMVIHSVLGFLIYFFNIAAILTSSYIPASPSMADCDADGNATGASAVVYLTIFWILIEILVHTAMTVLQCMKDREVGVKRFWLCPVVPILPHDSAQDFIGSSMRKITLMIYAAAAFVLASAMCAVIQGSQLSQECQMRTGESSCPSVWGCSSAALQVRESFDANVSQTYGSES